MAKVKSQRLLTRQPHGFSLLELMVAIAILSLVVTSLTIAFTQLNDGINDAYVQNNQTTQFYGIESLFAIDFGYHNVGVDSTTPPCYLRFSGSTWQSSCLENNSAYAEDNSAIMVCYKSPQNTQPNKVAYFFVPSDNQLCRYQWETTTCDNDPSTGTNPITTAYTSLSCDDGLIDEVESATFTVLDSASTLVDIQFASSAGVNQSTSIRNNFLVNIPTRNILGEYPEVNVDFTAYDVREGDSLDFQISLDAPAEDELTIQIAPGDLNCATPCDITINEGSYSGSITLNVPATMEADDTTEVTIIPNADLIVGDAYQSSINVIASAANDADHTPRIQIAASHYTMSTNSEDITVTLTLSQALTNPLNIDISASGMACGDSNQYTVLGTTTAGCPGETVTVSATIPANQTSMSFMLNPKTITTRDELTLSIDDNDAYEAAANSINIMAITSSDLPSLRILNNNTTLTLPHQSSAQFISQLRLALDRPLPYAMETQINHSGGLVCGEDFEFVGSTCSATHTFAAQTTRLSVPIRWLYHSENNHNQTVIFRLPSQNNVQIHISDAQTQFTGEELSAISFANASLSRPANTTVNFNVNATPALNGAITIDYSIDGVTSSTRWEMSDGQASKTFSIALGSTARTITINEIYGNGYVVSSNNSLTISIAPPLP